eukprot:TRINITY_DN15276_c0_g1_i1.p1 TRINITY_DN15276_c0_g1~~TRINITY_DN15276_c0_g1_i1.p1  ORF type:complete len:596 (+),score=158.51 TRINITY_DN15276_c0_g1_i1:63-1790(+)
MANAKPKSPPPSGFAKVVGFGKLLVALVLVLLRLFTLWLTEKLRDRPKTKAPYLQNNFAPVGDEIETRSLAVIGDQPLPADLAGVFVRNGPNPQFEPEGHYHWFDGDGMLHATRVKDGKAHYINRYVRTKRLEEEKEAGRATHIKLGDMMTRRGMLLLMLNMITQRVRQTLTRSKGPTAKSGTGNTSVLFHHRKFFALVEASFPVELSLPRCETLNQEYNFNERLVTPFTAHPKVDAVTGELVFFGYRFDKAPYAHHYVAAADGTITHSVPVDLEVPVMMHDFAVTENHSIFLNLPATFRPERAFRGSSAVAFERDRKSRFGVMKRHAGHQREITWFEDEACYVFHTANAWEEEDGDVVVLVACRSKVIGGSIFDTVGEEGTIRDGTPFLHMWRFDLRDNSIVSRTLLTDFGVEFPIINEALCGYKTRYAYVSRWTQQDGVSADSIAKRTDANISMFDAVIKYDFQTETYVTADLTPVGGHCGEWIFVPRSSADGLQLEEDDGYLVSYVHFNVGDADRSRCEFWVLDAKTMDSTPIARVAMPRRIPYGFHGKWVSDEQMTTQDGWSEEWDMKPLE